MPTPLEKQATRKVLTERVDLFAEFGLKNHTTLSIPPFHHEIYQMLQGNQRVAIAAPRGMAKSSVVSLIYALWCALTQRNRFIVILSDTYSQASLFLETIKRELEYNPLLQMAFGDQKTECWSQDTIELKVGCKIVAKGQGMKMRGLKYGNTRPDLVILDDLENSELVESKERRDKLERWFNAEVLPSVTPEGQIVYIGTIIHDDALLQKVLTKYDGWKTKIYKAEENGKLLWPERMSHEALQKLKDEYTKAGLLDIFYAEYMNEPMNDMLREFKREWFKYFSDDECPVNLRIFTTVDPAISKRESADESCVMTVGVTPDNNKFILEYSHGRWDPSELMEEIFRHYEKYAPVQVGIETVAYQEALSHFLKIEMRKRNVFMNIEEIKTRTNKEQRIRGLIAHYKSGSIYHRSGFTEALEAQMLRFPKGTHDDICFVAGTRIKTLFGEKNIEEIKTGDYVMTPVGLSRVREAKNTGRRRVKGYTFTNGRGLIATPGHPVYVKGKGFIPIDSLSIIDTLSMYSLIEICKTILQKVLHLKSFTKASNIEGSQRGGITWLSTRRIGKEKGQSSSTIFSGKRQIIGRSLWDFASTIKIMTTSTIGLKIFYLCRVLSMQNIMGSTSGRVQSEERGGSSIWIRSVTLPKNGMLQKRATVGILRTALTDGKTVTRLLNCVKCAGRNIKHFFLRALFPAAGLVTKEDDGATLKVYNLSVNAGMYYANGLLVSNCDALSFQQQLWSPPQYTRYRPPVGKSLKQLLREDGLMQRI